VKLHPPSSYFQPESHGISTHYRVILTVIFTPIELEISPFSVSQGEDVSSYNHLKHESGGVKFT
jgi:hypothetical protein